ncbi:hypothetical protein Y1Q_0001341 [Alligator mississippiensis]|uniref:Uncharacterized protein n=1 Tax=Alligator mississippiensis TaxID=8496 RepID=A0A151M930_ALLMI|nr:hypothetical protein Y1Q_0001341 [Alligator mississippiensis]
MHLNCFFAPPSLKTEICALFRGAYIFDAESNSTILCHNESFILIEKVQQGNMFNRLKNKEIPANGSP